MWFARGMMAWCVVLGIWGTVAGDAFTAVTAVICLIGNAANAEFCRRKLT
jgi:hypothetical protein